MLPKPNEMEELFGIFLLDFSITKMYYIFGSGRWAGHPTTSFMEIEMNV